MVSCNCTRSSMPFAAQRPPVLVRRRPLHRRSPPRHRQTGLRDLDPGELQPGAAGSVDLAAPGPDRLPDRAAGGGRGPRRARGPRQRRRRRLQGEACSGHLRRARHPQGADRPGQAWQNYIETHFNVMRRMADHHYARATTWGELQAVHDRFFHDYNHQPHYAHRERTDGRRSPAAVLGWVQGAWCDPADLDRLFRLRRAARSTPAVPSASVTGGSTGNAASPANGSPSGSGETVTIEYATETLAQYPGDLEADGRGLRGRRAPALRHGPRLAPAVPAGLGGGRVASGAAAGALPSPTNACRNGSAGTALRGRVAKMRPCPRLSDASWQPPASVWPGGACGLSGSRLSSLDGIAFVTLRRAGPGRVARPVGRLP